MSSFPRRAALRTVLGIAFLVLGVLDLGRAHPAAGLGSILLVAGVVLLGLGAYGLREARMAARRGASTDATADGAAAPAAAPDAPPAPCPALQPAHRPAHRRTGLPVVELVDTTKRYGDVEALRGFSFAAQAGELVAALGPNGAGKTTAISLMLGLREPSSGTARLFGLDPHDPLARSRTGVMLQDTGVPNLLTVRELVDLFRSYYPAPSPTDALLAAAGVDDLADRRVTALSGGQRQRVRFALACCGDPDVLFLDEPTTGLDVEARRALWAHIDDLRERGTTIVLTTHYLEEADALADRVVVIDRGVAIAQGTPADIKRSVGGKTIRFHAPGVTAAVFGGLPVRDVTVTGERVEAVTAEPEAVLRALFGAGVAIDDLEVTGIALEDAVVHLTSGAETAPLEARPTP